MDNQQERFDLRLAWLAAIKEKLINQKSSTTTRQDHSIVIRYSLNS